MRHLAILLLVVTSIPSAAFAASVTDPNLVVETVITSGGALNAPVGFAFIAPNDILVIEKNVGRVRRVTSGVLQAGNVLDLHVNNVSERGLLGIALPPDFASNHFVYLYWTQSSILNDSSVQSEVIAHRVTRYSWNGAALVSPVPIMTLPVLPGPNHDGGHMIFGPDGKLYIQTGDLNRNGQLQNYPTGPAPDSTGVILRINQDGSAPSDNPFFSLGAPMSPFYAYGIRNQFGMTFDPVTGILWQSENGPSQYDEVNAVGPGFNSGWEKIMGPDARDPQGESDLWSPSPTAFYSDPEFSWLSPVCVTAVAFPDVGGLGAAYSDAFLVGDCNDGRIFRFEMNASRDGFTFTHVGLADLVGDSETEMAELAWGSGFSAVTDMRSGADGSLYVLSFTGLYRIFDPDVLAAGDPVPPPAALTNAPNPFSDRTTIRVAMARPGVASLAIFDVSGRLVRKLHDGPIAEGVRAFVWDGQDDEGRRVAAGVYHLRLSGDGRTLSHRAIRVN